MSGWVLSVPFAIPVTPTFSATSRISKRPLQAPSADLSCASRPRASRPIARTNIQKRRGLCLCRAEALRDEYKAIVDAGLILQVDDAYWRTLRVMVPPQTPRDYRQMASVRISASHGSRAAARAHAHIMCARKLERAARTLCRAQDFAGFHPQGKHRRLPLEMANPARGMKWRVWEHVKLPKRPATHSGVIFA